MMRIAPIKTLDDLRSAIKTASQDTYWYVSRMARVLGAETELPDDWSASSVETTDTDAVDDPQDTDAVLAAGLKYVRTQAGVKRYGLPIGAPIVGVTGLTKSKFKPMFSNGKLVGYHRSAGNGNFVTLQKTPSGGMFWSQTVDKKVINSGTTDVDFDELVEKLDLEKPKPVATLNPTPSKPKPAYNVGDIYKNLDSGTKVQIDYVAGNTISFTDLDSQGNPDPEMGADLPISEFKEMFTKKVSGSAKVVNNASSSDDDMWSEPAKKNYTVPIVDEIHKDVGTGEEITVDYVTNTKVGFTYIDSESMGSLTIDEFNKKFTSEYDLHQVSPSSTGESNEDSDTKGIDTLDALGKDSDDVPTSSSVKTKTAPDSPLTANMISIDAAQQIDKSLQSKQDKPVLAFATDKVDLPETEVEEAVDEGQVQDFVKGKTKILGKIDHNAKKGNFEHANPKKTMADGVKPALGMNVITEDGKSGKITVLYQTAAVVLHDDGTKKTYNVGKLNKSSTSTEPVLSWTDSATSSGYSSVSVGKSTELSVSEKMNGWKWRAFKSAGHYPGFEETGTAETKEEAQKAAEAALESKTGKKLDPESGLLVSIGIDKNSNNKGVKTSDYSEVVKMAKEELQKDSGGIDSTKTMLTDYSSISYTGIVADPHAQPGSKENPLYWDSADTVKWQQYGSILTDQKRDNWGSKAAFDVAKGHTSNEFYAELNQYLYYKNTKPKPFEEIANGNQVSVNGIYRLVAKPNGMWLLQKESDTGWKTVESGKAHEGMAFTQTQVRDAYARHITGYAGFMGNTKHDKRTKNLLAAFDDPAVTPFEHWTVLTRRTSRLTELTGLGLEGLSKDDQFKAARQHIGEEITMSGFKSTRITTNSLNESSVSITYVCPPGTKGIYVSYMPKYNAETMSYYPQEEEVILPHNTRVRILDIQRDHKYGGIRAVVEVIPDKGEDK